MLETIYTTSYHEYNDHLEIYKQKRKELEPCFTPQASEKGMYDQIISDALLMFHTYESDSKVDSVFYDFQGRYGNKISCDYTVSIDLEFVDSDYMPKQVEIKGKASLVKENRKWQVNDMEITATNIQEVLQLKFMYDTIQSDFR